MFKQGEKIKGVCPLSIRCFWGLTRAFSLMAGHFISLVYRHLSLSLLAESWGTSIKFSGSRERKIGRGEKDCRPAWVFHRCQKQYKSLIKTGNDSFGDRTQNLWFRRPAPYPLGQVVKVKRPSWSRPLSFLILTLADFQLDS